MGNSELISGHTVCHRGWVTNNNRKERSSVSVECTHGFVDSMSG
jgi:hypothetical protein